MCKLNYYLKDWYSKALNNTVQTFEGQIIDTRTLKCVYKYYLASLHIFIYLLQSKIFSCLLLLIADLSVAATL